MAKNMKEISLFIVSLILVSLVSAVSVSYSTLDQIAPGKFGDITVTVSNDEDFDIENVDVKLVLENLPFSSPESEKSISSIKEDREKSIEFEIKALER